MVLVDLKDDAVAEKPARQRIIEAAFKAFSDKGYEGASTLGIATQAKVSKRDLYANFGNKHEMLVACIEGRAARMNLAVKLPSPNSLAKLESVLATFGSKVLTQVSDPTIIAVHRLAIAEAARSPEIAQTLEKVARRPIHQALTQFMSEAQARGGLAEGDPAQFATEFLALTWEGLWINLVLGIVPTPSKNEVEEQSKRAARSFMTLRGTPSPQGGCRA